MTALRLPDISSRSWHFLRTPKGILLLILAIFAFLALPHEGGGGVATVAAAVTAGTILDLAIGRAYEGSWQFPAGGSLTSLLVAMVMRTQEPLAVVTAAAVIAIVSKHLVRTRWSNVFNPAAFGLVAVALIFRSGESWWGALPNLGLPGLVLLLVAGVFIANHINKLPLVLAFLGPFAGMATVETFIGHSAQVAELFRTPDLQAALFFAFFMLDDPPTCPIRYEDQVVFGAICALVSYAVFRSLGPDYFLLAGLLVANGWESSRRLLVGKLPAAFKRSSGLSLAGLGLASLVVCLLPLGASASSSAPLVAAAPQPAVVVVTPIAPEFPRRGAGRENRRNLAEFTGSAFENGWRLTSPQFPGEVLEVLNSGQAQLLQRETRDVDFLGTADALPKQGRGTMNLSLGGSGPNTGITQTLAGTYEMRGTEIRFTAGVSRSGLER